MQGNFSDPQGDKNLMVYLGLNAEFLPPTGASGYYLPGGPKNYSTQKVITYSDSTQKTVQENVFCLYGTILNLVTKMAQTFPKSDQFLSSMQTGRCNPYDLKQVGNNQARSKNH